MIHHCQGWLAALMRASPTASRIKSHWHKLSRAMALPADARQVSDLRLAPFLSRVSDHGHRR
jgi:hypothetical protein